RSVATFQELIPVLGDRGRTGEVGSITRPAYPTDANLSAHLLVERMQRWTLGAPDCGSKSRSREGGFMRASSAKPARALVRRIPVRRAQRQRRIHRGGALRPGAPVLRVAG